MAVSRLSSTLNFAVLSILTAAAPAAADQLAVGSKAPPLNIEHWISNNGGKFKPVKSFEPGKVYVVEFWATWCTPCIASMPHLAELQKKYADKAVQIVSVSDEELDTVKGFLSRQLPDGIAKTIQPSSDAGSSAENEAEDNAKTASVPMTFGQLTATYCLTTDPDQSVYQDYMEASGESGIPTSFIVGKTGQIEWVGHPMEIDQPLAEVVDDQWDRKKFISSQKEKKLVEAGLNEVYELLDERKNDQALKKLEALIKQTASNEMNLGLRMMKLELLMQFDPKKAVVACQELVSSIDNAETLNGIAWTILEVSKDEQYKVSPELIDAAVAAVEKAAKLSPEDGSVLDTLAHLLELKGDLVRAIEVMTRATELLPEIAELKAYLQQLKKAASSK